MYTKYYKIYFFEAQKQCKTENNTKLSSASIFQSPSKVLTNHSSLVVFKTWKKYFDHFLKQNEEIMKKNEELL